MSRHALEAGCPSAVAARRRRGRFVRAGRVTLAWLIAATLPVTVAGQAAASRESQVKAAFLFNFGQFVTWPADRCPATDGPFVIGVLGTDRFGETLEALTRDATIQDRPVAIERYESVEDVGTCQILFVSASETDRLERVFDALAGKHVLTVGETPEFAAGDGVIALLLAGTRLRMEINTAAAATADLTISSKLLRLADVVRAEGS
ncbi:MAG: YfiR family protein [Gemmatimonadales bacterium]